MQRRPILAAAGLAIAATCASAVAQSVEPAPQPASLPDVLIEHMRAGARMDDYFGGLLNELRRVDRADDGLDRDDVRLSRALAEAEARGQAVQEVLGYDLDGDLQTTRAEMEMASDRAANRRHEQADRQLADFDVNGDGKITIAEAVERRDRPRPDSLDDLLALDPDGDGRLTASELRRIAYRAFAVLDTDGNETLSAQEYGPIEKLANDARLARLAPQCKLPPLPKDAQLIAVGTYGSPAISSAVIGSFDTRTNLTDLTIEPGPQRLYLVLTSYESMVWRISGATGRVAKVVVTSFGDGSRFSRSGVMGLARSKVEITDADCPGYFRNAGRESVIAAGTLKRSLGRGPDAIFGFNDAQAISLPSGTSTETDRNAPPAAPPGFDQQMWKEAVRFWPAGLVQVDPRRVVAKAPVRPYLVLPSQMGLAQLLGSGAIERLPRRRYRIVRAIPHFPPGMSGAHSATLVIAKGVPTPPGNPGHSCVIDEATGQATRAACARPE